MTPDRRTFLSQAGLAALAVGAATTATGCTRTAPAGPAPGTTLKVPADSIPVGGGRILTEGQYVVTQPEAGVYKAFNKTCTHLGCPVSDIRGDKIHCNCHGAEFSIADGSVTRGPATKPLREAKATLNGDNVEISTS